MGDLTTRYDLIFEDSNKRYVYHHEHCRLTSKLVRLMNEYQARGFDLVCHVMSDLGTRHELFFEMEW